MQSPIHEGYEYQDYFTVSIILQLMLKQTDAEIIIDRKDFSGDKFDDLKVKTPNGTTEFQIKYSDDEYSHKLAKDDFANGNGHDTALCDLFASWKTRKESENDTQIKLCLAWNRPDDDDPIVEFLKPIQEQALPFSIVAYSFDGEVFWPVGNLPPKTWRKFNLAVKSGLIDREAFLSFCNELTIILEMPKASLDLKNPGGIENVIIRQAEKLGVGIYPNDNLNLEEVIYKLATEVKRSRAMGNRLYINTLMGRLGFIRDYGKFDQRFPVDSAHKVMLDDEIESLHRAIRDSKRVIITGNPGSGKSWLVDEYIDKLENDDSKVIHYNCFQSLQDTNSLERIRVTSLYGNLVCIIRSAARIRNLVALITASELLAMLDDMNEFESTGEEYFQALCDIKGASKLNQLMQIDGKPSFDMNTGKIACYISSKAGITPWWKLYLDIEAKQYKIEELKYYYRYYLDEQGVSIIPKLMEAIEKEKASIRNQCIEIAYGELKDYIEFDEIASIAEEQQLIYWKNYLSYIETGYYPQSEISFEVAIGKWEKIKTLRMPGEKDIRIFIELFSQIYYLAEQGDRKVIETVCSDCENINWFYNWIIYSVKMAELCAHTEQMNSKIICESVITNLELLLQDTEVFKGEPRTCDLYFLQNELTRSYEQAIELIVQNGTVDDLEKALSILERLDDETGTSLDHTMGGPLTDAEFLEVISRFLTINNYEIVKPYLLRTQEKIEKNEVYDCIAAAKLRFVSLISKYNQTEALECFDISTRYLVAYGYHKDIILLQIMDSYNVFFESVSGNPEEERDTITKMTIALWNHTDGRETKHFLNRWFDKLLKTDSRHALAFLFELQIKFGKSWVVEGMLRSAIEKYCNDLGFLDIVIGLIESLPNDTSPRIIDASTSIFRTLEQMCTGADVDERLLIKSRMKEFVINIVSRYNILDNPWPDNDSWKDGSIKEFLLTVEAAGFDVSQYIEYFHIKKTNDMENKEDKKTIDVFEATQTCFEALTPEDAKKWFETHDLIERDVQDICEFLKNYQNDKGTLLELLRFIITKSGGWSYSQKRKDIILQIIGRLELDDEEMSEVHMLMYLYSYEWGSSLIDKDEFLNSIRLSSDVGRNTFYSELPEVIISHSGRITKGLLDALFAFEYDKDIIVEIWRNVFDIMKLRFPNLDQYTSDNIFEETDELLELRNCLLMRFIDGGKESFLATYAYLANAAEKEKFSEFTESIVFCLEHYEQYNLVTQIAIADLVRCYGWCLKDMNIDRMISAINVVYPTGNLLLDVIFSEFTVYNSYLLMCSDKHAPDYMEQEDVEFYLAEQLYDLGKEEVQEGTDEYAENSVYRDPIMQVLDTSGINYIEIYKKLHASRRLNDKMQDFVGGASKILETNTVYKSYVIQYALHAIIEKAFIDREPELLPQTLFRLIPDYQGMYKLFKCRDMQPQNHLYDKNNSCEPFLINNKDEYILIGCSEIKKHIDYHQTSLIFAYQGIVGEAGDEHQIPFQQYLATAVEEGEIYTILDNPESLIDFIRTLDRELEDEDYLWPGTSVSKLLDVHIEFDFLNGRYIAINQEKDVVFIMKKWSSSYKGDSEYHGNAIPLYSGTKLYIKKEYIGILEQQFGTLMMKTCVQSYTQDY